MSEKSKAELLKEKLFISKKNGLSDCDNAKWEKITKFCEGYKKFLSDGKTVDRMPLEAFVGECFVARHEGELSAADAEEICKRADGAQRILIAGKATVTAGAARVFSEKPLLLLGNEGQTVGPAEAPMEVHLILLGRGIALLEGIVLTDVPEGRYFLSAAPLNLGGADGAPCRAYLIGEGD